MVYLQPKKSTHVINNNNLSLAFIITKRSCHLENDVFRLPAAGELRFYPERHMLVNIFLRYICLIGFFWGKMLRLDNCTVSMHIT